MSELTIVLNSNSNVPMYEQIYRYIKEEIRQGKLEKGMRLPSGRTLCSYLEVSRSTVLMAYEQLLSEGYIESKPGSGYYVAEIEGLHWMGTRLEKAPVVKIEKEESVLDFSPRGINLNSFPFNHWRKITKNVLVDDNKELFALGNPKGELDLRIVIAQYLYQSRGVNCNAENIIIGAGNEYLLLILSQLLGKNAVYALENPGYMQTFRILDSLEKRCVPIDLDESGMRVELLEKSEATVAYVTPSHQYPLGIVMPVKRRQELLSWASKVKNRYIIEDDYDSEFRYKGKPIPALCGMDREDRVIHIGTFSKSIAPAIRMSYMVLPNALLEEYNRKINFYSCTVSRMDQNIVQVFIKEGYFERHLNKMRAIYKARHDVLLRELKDFSEKFRIEGENAGLHILLTSYDKKSESELIKRAAEVGVAVYPLSLCYLKDTNEQSTVVLGYANMSEEQIIEGVAKLREAWKI